MSLKVSEATGEVVGTSFLSIFATPTSGREPGSMIIQNYDFSWDNDSREFVVVEAEKEDRQAYIDSFADDCGVYNVLKKFAKTNDLSLLHQSEGFYGDISDLPVDELNPAQYEAAAKASVAELSKKLGEDLTAEALSEMSVDEINALIERAVAARVEKSTVVKEGE